MTQTLFTGKHADSLHWSPERQDEALAALKSLRIRPSHLGAGYCHVSYDGYTDDPPDERGVTMTIDAEILGLVRHKQEVHDALVRLFRSAAPHATPDDDTLYLITQLDNVIAGYRESLHEINSKALVYADQVGDGQLLADVRYGFYKLAHMAPAWSGLPDTVTTE